MVPSVTNSSQTHQTLGNESPIEACAGMFVCAWLRLRLIRADGGVVVKSACVETSECSMCLRPAL